MEDGRWKGEEGVAVGSGGWQWGVGGGWKREDWM